MTKMTSSNTATATNPYIMKAGAEDARTGRTGILNISPQPSSTVSILSASQIKMQKGATQAFILLLSYLFPAEQFSISFSCSTDKKQELQQEVYR